MVKIVIKLEEGPNNTVRVAVQSPPSPFANKAEIAAGQKLLTALNNLLNPPKNVQFIDRQKTPAPPQDPPPPPTNGSGGIAA